MGGFTTYSTFNYETLQYLLRDEWLIGLVYLGVMLAGCLVAGGLGMVAGRILAGA